MWGGVGRCVMAAVYGALWVAVGRCVMGAIYGAERPGPLQAVRVMEVWGAVGQCVMCAIYGAERPGPPQAVRVMEVWGTVGRCGAVCDVCHLWGRASRPPTGGAGDGGVGQ